MSARAATASGRVTVAPLTADAGKPTANITIAKTAARTRKATDGRSGPDNECLGSFVVDALAALVPGRPDEKRREQIR